MKNWITSKEYRNITGISSQHLYHLKKEGKIAFKQITEKKFLYPYPEELSSKNIAIYSRVSTTKQKKDLENQQNILINYCNKNGMKVDYTFSDIASGMNENRKDLNKLLKEVTSGKISKIFITYKDRLTRFGYGYLETFCNIHGTTIEVLNSNENKSFQEELTEDLISIIHHFSMKFYGKRRKLLNTLKNEVNS
jgi:predicted site-specific integrase-resolvase